MAQTVYITTCDSFAGSVITHLGMSARGFGAHGEEQQRPRRDELEARTRQRAPWRDPKPHRERSRDTLEAIVPEMASTAQRFAPFYTRAKDGEMNAQAVHRNWPSIVVVQKTVAR